jgi:hypothetical protein
MASLSASSRPRFKIKLRLMNTPREMLLQDLQRVARLSGKRSPTVAIYNQHGRVSAQSLVRRFGSWNQALAAAQLPINKQHNIAQADLFENLAQLWRRLGRQPVATDMVRKKRQSRYSASAYRARFGTWNRALQAFDAYINCGKKPAAAKKKPRRVRHAISWRLRATVLLRDNCTCRMCGASPARDRGVRLHVDHITPWARGGATALDNLQTLCSACNIGKSDRLCAPTRPKTSRPCSGRRRRSPPKRRR